MAVYRTPRQSNHPHDAKYDESGHRHSADHRVAKDNYRPVLLGSGEGEAAHENETYTRCA